jgi:glycosyltransferase involved in cell wall biosynthesis
MTDKNIAICVLSFNTEKYILKVLNDLKVLKFPIVIIDDASNDKSLDVVKDFKKENPDTYCEVIENKSNKGAGQSCRTLIKHCKEIGYKYIVKVDGDDQFDINDIKKIILKLETKKYDFIKSNRFWSGGITGDIPKIRYFGNLIATQFLHFATGTNKIYDPLNGLFGINTEISESLNNKKYPKRYGYPFYITSQAILNDYPSLQINNHIKYSDQESNIKPLKLLFSLIRQTLFFNRKKYQLKKLNYKLHKSLFYEIVFKFFLIIELLLILRFVLGYFTTIPLLQTNIAGWGILVVIFASLIVFIYSVSFNLENEYRKEFISLDE